MKKYSISVILLYFIATGIALSSILLLISCRTKARLSVTTLNVSGIMQTSAQSGGEVKAGNRLPVNSKGVCWAMTPDPALTDNKTDEGTGRGTYLSTMTSLQPGTQYYVRAYAITDYDTVYGQNVSFSTEDYTTITDAEGNTYGTIRIGKQTWMAQNLRTATYNDGSAIPLVVDESRWTVLSTPAFCWYRNDKEAFSEIYGALYNWYSVNTGKLCPKGWHIPSDEEWTELVINTGGNEIAGGKLKDSGTTYWVEPNYGATNDFGFTALPGGFRYYDGKFFDFGFSSYWWSSRELSNSRAFFRFIYYNESKVYRFDNNKKNGFSVRCLKD